MNAACEKCKVGPWFHYEVFGVFCLLCPSCRTDLQEFIISDSILRDFWVSIAQRNQHIADPLLMQADSRQAEIDAFHKVREWLRTPLPTPDPVTLPLYDFLEDQPTAKLQPSPATAKRTS